MLDVIELTRILADTSHTNTVGVIAPEVLHKNVGSIGLGREAVVANIDSSVRDTKSIHVQRIESIGVLGQRLNWSV